MSQSSIIAKAKERLIEARSKKWEQFGISWNEDDEKNFLEQEILTAIQEHNRVLEEKGIKLLKKSENYVPFQKIHYQSGVKEFLELLSEHVPVEGRE